MAQQTTMFLEGVYPRVRPDAALLWYNDPDITFHHEGLGSPAAVAALAALDHEFGRLMDWIASPAPGRPVQVLLVSDHGHITARERIGAKQALAGCGLALADGPARSEEHTSELQSLMRISYAVFCLKHNKSDNTKKIY